MRRFLIIARGSIAESQNWIYKLAKLGYISQARAREYEELFEKVRIKSNALIGKLTRS